MKEPPGIRTFNGSGREAIGKLWVRSGCSWPHIGGFQTVTQGKGDPSHQQRAESDRILAALDPSEKVVVLDERGKLLTSPAFAQRLGNWRDQGLRDIAFVIGGAYGMTEDVRQRADLVLSLSPMVFPHQLIRVLFAEQLYRGLSILKGTGYHHG